MKFILVLLQTLVLCALSLLSTATYQCRSSTPTSYGSLTQCSWEAKGEPTCNDVKKYFFGQTLTAATFNARINSPAIRVFTQQWRIGLFDLKGGIKYNEAKFTVSNVPGGIDAVVCKAKQGYMIYRFSAPVTGDVNVPITCVSNKDISYLDFCNMGSIQTPGPALVPRSPPCPTRAPAPVSLPAPRRTHTPAPVPMSAPKLFQCEPPTRTFYGSVTECIWNTIGQPDCHDIKDYYENTTNSVPAFGAKIDAPAVSISTYKWSINLFDLKGGRKYYRTKFRISNIPGGIDTVMCKAAQGYTIYRFDVPVTGVCNLPITCIEMKDISHLDFCRIGDILPTSTPSLPPPPSPTPSPKPSPTPSRTPTPCPKQRPTPSPCPKQRPTPSPKPTPSQEPTPMPTETIGVMPMSTFPPGFTLPPPPNFGVTLSPAPSPSPVCEFDCTSAPQKACGLYVSSACVFTTQATCDQSGTICEGSIDAPFTGICQYTYMLNSSSTICRPAQVGEDGTTCDMDEFCTGSSLDCPEDEFFSQGTECRDQAGECDKADVCSGSSPVCEDLKQESSVLCREAAGSCDIEEFCTGVSNFCPDDTFLGNTTVCRYAVGVCDKDDYCSGVQAGCEDQKKDTNEVCRAANGPCDVEEYCDGLNDLCPDDNFLDSSVMCRAADGPCDLDDYCSGDEAGCQDTKLDSSVVCRAATGACDAVETCDGVSNFCPEDSLSSNTTMCRSAAGPCDAEEYCDGMTDSCPDDVYHSSGTLCRPRAGPCDKDDFCSGTSVTCVDEFLPPDTLCKAAIGPCDLDDYCSGTSAVCTDVRREAGSNIELMIDDFYTGIDVFVSASVMPTKTNPSPTPVSTGALSDSLLTLGGERDVYIAKTYGQVEERVRVRVDPNNDHLLRLTLDIARGFTTITWDGYDGRYKPNEVNYTGLGGFTGTDFSYYNQLLVTLSLSDVGGPASFTIWDASDPTGNTFAKGYMTIPGSVVSNSQVPVLIDLSSFVATGASLANILDSVGAMQMTIDATSSNQTGWDVRIDNVKLKGVC